MSNNRRSPRECGTPCRHRSDSSCNIRSRLFRPKFMVLVNGSAGFIASLDHDPRHIFVQCDVSESARIDALPPLAVDASKIARDLGWKPARSFDSGLCAVEWYLANPQWLHDIQEKLDP